MLVLDAHRGETVELACDGTTRVSELIQSLAAATRVPAADQLLVFGGQRLEPSRTLASRGLPEDAATRVTTAIASSSASSASSSASSSAASSAASSASEKPRRRVFLYRKSLLKPGAPPPALPPHVPVEVDRSSARVETAAERDAAETAETECDDDRPRSSEDCLLGHHPLAASPSPRVRALPRRERVSVLRGLDAAATLRASEARFSACAALVAKIKTQALAVDAARDNADAHYEYIRGKREAFERRFAAQTKRHGAILRRLEGELEFLGTIRMHPAVRTHAERRLRLKARLRSRDEAAKEAEGMTRGDDDSETTTTSAAREADDAKAAEARNEAERGSTRRHHRAPPTSTSTRADGSSPAAPAAPPPSPARETLLDCVPSAKLRRRAADCASSRERFGRKVRDLAAKFSSLALSAEALFMQGPDVDPDALALELRDAGAMLDAARRAMRSVDADVRDARERVEDAVGKLHLGGGVLGGEAPENKQTEEGADDRLGADVDSPRDPAMKRDAASETASSETASSETSASADASEAVLVALEDVRRADSALAAFHAHCDACFSASSSAAHAQFQSVGALQSQIRDMRDALVAFEEVGARQEAAFEELRGAFDVAEAYAACLAEAARRRRVEARWRDDAARFAERAGARNEKEKRRREAFARGGRRRGKEGEGGSSLSSSATGRTNGRTSTSGEDPADLGSAAPPPERMLPGDVARALGLRRPTPSTEVVYSSADLDLEFDSCGLDLEEGGTDDPRVVDPRVVTEEDARAVAARIRERRAREREAAAAADAGEASAFESSPAGSTRRFLAGGEPGGGGATASLSSDADDEPADRLGSDGSDEDGGEGEGEGEGGAWRLERERLEAELAKARAENAALAETLRRRDEALRALAVGGRGFDGE